MASNKQLEKEIEQLKTELMGLKIRFRRLENYVLDFPNPEDYMSNWDSDTADDELAVEATKIVRRYDRASASLLQRRLSIGYARAARLIDILEQRGVIGPGDGAKPRKVFKKAKP